MVKVLLYHPWVYLKGGAEKVLLEYVKHTVNDVRLHAGYLGHNTFEELIPITEVSTNRLFSVGVTRTISSSLKSLLAIVTTRLSKEKADVLLISSEGLGDFLGLVRWRVASRTIAFVHTPLKLVYDNDSIASTKERISTLPFYFFVWVIKPLYKVVNRLIWKRYDFVIANSSETKKRIVEGKLAPASKIKIIYPGTNLVEKSLLTPPHIKFAAKVFLIAGRIMIQKNIEQGIAAFLQANVDGAKLVIAGHCDAKSQAYLASLLHRYESDAVMFFANPSDDQYKALFQSAYCLVFPPVNEDWGIIPIEAMSFGMPVICSNRGGPSESVIHKKTGLLCDPKIDGFASAISTFANMPVDTYVQYSINARSRSEAFTWATFAQQLDKALVQGGDY